MTQPPAKILAVDDEPDVEPLIRQGLKKQIQSGDYELSFASDGVEALELLERDTSIELVLTDLKMPRMDGLTLLGRVRELNRQLKAVVVTAYGDVENIRTAMNQGAFDFLMKPLRLDDLRTTVEKAIRAVGQQKQAELVREAFGRYLSVEVVRTLLDHPESLKLGGEERRVSLLMSDLRGFSTISETLPPEKVVEMLNIYLGRMADVIAEYEGTIIEFVGDAIFVVFGAPIQREDDAVRAVACATAMQLAMADVNSRMNEMGIRDLEMGIGLHTGGVVVGNIGSIRRAKYAAVGSHVNLVGRIESWTVGGQILASSDTVSEVGPITRVGKELTLLAKGFTEPVKIFEIEGIGAPYDLWLQVREEPLIDLDPSVACGLTLLDGKVLTGEAYRGEVLQLSRSRAVIHVDEPVDLMSNVMITLQPLQNTVESGSGLYGKVVEVVAETGDLMVRFTAVPEDVSSVIDLICVVGSGSVEAG